MSQLADKQTTDDLGLFGKYKHGSVYSLFNKVRTRGGEQLLDRMFDHPLSDRTAIDERSRIFRYFAAQRTGLPFTREQFGSFEDYLASGGGRYWLGTLGHMLRMRVLETLVNDKAYAVVRTMVDVTSAVLHACREWMNGLLVAAGQMPAGLQQRTLRAASILMDPRLSLVSSAGAGGLSFWQIARLHHLFQHVLQPELIELCSILHELDVYIGVGKVASERGFTFAHCLPEEEHVFHAEDLRHPCLDGGIGNDVKLDRYRNVLFLTGANMAGKSTFMKAMGINLYLAHMGFPVAARQLVFSIREGIYSSINVPDSLDQGYSHFYAEVRRVKTVAEEVAGSKSLLVIFDELFKGTNVKDAYDATLAVTAAFGRYRKCWFIISTHIIEVGDALREQYDNLQFAYMPTQMDGRTARYTYRLAEGITSDRHGMMIIQQEGIFDIINAGK